MACCWQGHAQFGSFFTHKGVRHLHQQASAVTQFRVVTGRTTVRQVVQQLQALGDDIVALLAFNMGDKAHATAILFVASVV